MVVNKTVLGSRARESVVRLRDCFKRELKNNRPLVPLNRVVADALDIGRNTVLRITREKLGQEEMSENALSSPKKKRVKPITDVDSFAKDAITLPKLQTSLNNADLFKGGIYRKILRCGKL